MLKISSLGLRARLMILVLLAFIPVFIIIIYTNIRSQSHAAKEINHDILSYVRIAEAKQAGVFDGIKQLLNILTDFPAIREKDAAVCDNLFNKILDKSPYLTQIGAADAEGNVFAAASSVADLDNVKNRHFFKRAFSTMGFSAGNYHFSTALNKPIINLATPVFGPDMKVMMVLFASLDLGWLSDELNKTLPFSDISASVLDAEGVVIAQEHSTRNLIGQKYPAPEIINIINSDRRDTLAAFNDQGIRSIYAFSAIGPAEPRLATLVISIREDQAYELTDQLWMINLITILTVSVLALAAAWFVGGPALVRPVSIMLEAMQKITQGELNTRVGGVEKKHDLSELADAFNHMAQHLETYYSRLDREIKERRQTETELKKNEELLDRTQQISLTASWEWNLALNECRWSNQQFRLFGYSPGEAAPSTELFEQHIHPGDRDRVALALKRAIEDGDETTLEYRYVRRDGGVRFARAIVLVEKNADGTPEKIRGAFQDITVTKLILEALKKSEETSKALLNAPEDSAILIDSSGTILAVNDVAAEKAGFPPEIMAGSNFLDHDFGLARDKYLYILNKTIKLAEPQVYEENIGETVNDFRFFPVFSTDGEVERAAVFIRDVTEKSRAYETAAKLAAVVSSSDDAIIGKNPQGIILTWNIGAEKIYGYKEQEVIGRSMNIVIPPDKPDELADIMARVNEGMTLTRYETERIAKNGDRLIVSMTISPVRDQKGEIIGAATVARDVTEQRIRDRKLEEREQQYFALFENSHSVMLVLDPVRARVLDANTAACMYYGYSRDELIDMPVDRLNTLPLEKIQKAMADAKKENQGEFQFKHRLASGEIRDVEVFSGPITIGGRPLLYSIIHDITKRKWSERELLRVNRALSTLSACNKTLVYAQDERKLLAEICRHLVNLGEHFFAWTCLMSSESNSIDITAHAGFNAGYLEAVNPNLDDEGCYHPMRATTQTGKTFIANDLAAIPETSPWIRKALDLGYNSILCLPLKNREQVVGAINLFSDKAQAFPDEEVLFLEELAGDASYGLTTRRLEKAHAKAESERIHLEKHLRQAQKMEAIGALAGGIAHDFNNILGAVIGFAQMAILEVEEESQVARDIEQILKAGSRAADLVKHILAFSRQTEMEKELLEPGPIIKEALKLLRASLPSTIEIKTSISAQGLRVLADPTQIHQIIMNLCTNAAHAMMERGGVLEVVLEREDITNSEDRPNPAVESYLRLMIKDDGAGIRPEILEKIFDPYFTTKAPGQGTGLGLAMVHSIVQALGGGIKVDSRVNQGSTFNIYIPMTQAAAPPKIVPMKDILKGSERILFVDDEPALVELSVKSLERLGYNVTAKTDSLEALELFMLQPYEYDIVITDQTMPKLVGLELAARMLKIRPDIPIILCTGFGADYTEESVKAAGLRGLALKPLLINDAAKKIREALDSRVHSEPK